MKKIVIMMVLVIFLSSCQKEIVQEEPEDFEKTIDSLIGTRTEKEGSQILEYPREEISSGVFLEKKVEYKKTEDGFDGTIMLEFSGESDTRHVEVIPKEFAESVDDLSFSVEPTRIINPDPEVEWDLKFEGLGIVGIEIKTKGKGTAVELFDSFDKQKSFILCNKIPSGMRDACFMAAVGKLKEPKLSDCDIIKSSEWKDTCFGAIAAASGDITACAKNIKSKEVRTMCYTSFAAVKGDKSICEKIEDLAERKVCLLVFEAKEKGLSTEELVEEKSKEPIDPKEDIVFDLRILANDENEYYTKRSYGFEAMLDPPDALPKNPEYEFIFSDGETKKGSTDTITREFKKAGTYTLTAKIHDKTSGKVVATKSGSFTFNEEEKEETSTGLSAEECTDTGKDCADSCNKLCEEKKGEYCDKHGYSGCALDVFCWCNVCAIYDTKWCPNYPGYMGCAEGTKGKYRSCIESCQSKREAGSDVSTCWGDCNTEFNDAIIECKQEPCKEFCDGKGFSDGVWAKYTQESGWDSCYCSDG